MKNALIGNWQTTVVGLILAIAYYLKQNGEALPTTKQEWANFAVAVLFAALGIASKDASVGSKA